MNTNLEVTYRGRVLLLLGILATFAAWINKGSSVRLASAILMAPILIDFLWGGLRLPPMRLIMRRRRTENGAPFAEFFTLQNLSPRRSVVDLHVREPRTDTYAGGFFIHHLDPGQTEVLRVPARTRSRGRIYSRSVVAVSSYPLGLIRRSTVLRAETELVSEPSRVRLPRRVMHVLERDAPEDASLNAIGEDEFHSLREYAVGEDARFVHAMRSAATGTLVRRIMHHQQQHEACLILDMRRPPGRSIRAGSRRLEWSLGATATVVDAMKLRSTTLTCFVIGDRDERWVLNGTERVDDFLTHLAEARPVGHRPLTQGFLDEVERFETCLWVPAGGFKASIDREATQQPILVTEWEEIS